VTIIYSYIHARAQNMGLMVSLTRRCCF